MEQWIWSGIIFEGDYLNGKRWNGKGYSPNNELLYELINGNGKIKEYWREIGNQKFEGEYLNGKRNGKGKEYNYHGQLIFEGEYVNGEKNGKGKNYINNDKIRFDGEYLDDKEWIGKGYDADGNLIYEMKVNDGIRKIYDLFGKLEFEGE